MRGAGTALAVTPKVTDVFPELDGGMEDFVRVLDRLSLTDTVFDIAQLGALVSTRHLRIPFDAQEAALGLLAPSLPRRLALNRWDASRKANGSSGRAQIVYRGQLLELLRWVVRSCEDLPNDGGTFADEQRCDDLLAALLFAGQLFSRRADASLSKPGCQTEDEKLAWLRRQWKENHRVGDAHLAMGRSSELLLEHLPREWGGFRECFEAARGMTIEQHFACVAAFYFNFVELNGRRPGGTPDVTGIFKIGEVAASCAKPELVDAFLEHHSTTAESLKHELWSGRSDDIESDLASPPAAEFRRLRNRPIFRAADGRCAIIDPVFFLEVALHGPLFCLGETKKALGLYGEAVEAYGQAVIDRTYPGGGCLGAVACHNVDVVEGKGKKLGGFDWVVSTGSYAAVFECKSMFPKDELLHAGAEASLTSYLADKLARDKDDKDGRKGTAQLARLILGLSQRSRAAWPDVLQAAQVFLPVLVVADDALDEHVERFLKRKLAQQLGWEATAAWHPWPLVEDASSIRVAPLVLLSLAELELLETLAAHGHGVVELLAEHARTPLSRRGTFSCFVRSQPALQAARRRRNDHLRSRADEVMQRSLRIIFGPDDAGGTTT